MVLVYRSYYEDDQGIQIIIILYRWSWYTDHTMMMVMIYRSYYIDGHGIQII